MSTATDLPKTGKVWILNKYAQGPINEETFKLKDEPVPEVSTLPKDHILVKVQTLAFEPSMRPSVSTEKSYRPAHPLGKPMWALGIGQVVGSSSNNFKVGSKVYGLLNMQEYALIDTTQGTVGPYDESLGIEHIAALGPAGGAAHLGLFYTAQLKKGEVVLVSGAAGATGTAVSERFRKAGFLMKEGTLIQLAVWPDRIKKVVQLARGAGASRVIGIASKSKCQSVVKAGADECLDYTSPTFAQDLKRVTQEKVNVYFDNTGGPITDAALVCMAPKGRVAVCGAISEYQKLGGDDDLYHGIKNWRFILTQELTVKGFIRPNIDPEIRKQADDELKQFIREGKVKSEIYTFPQAGIEHCIEALLGLFTGQNTGKMTLKVAD